MTPASMTVKAGILTGEVTGMKVTELTGTLKLKNTSANQSVRLVTGRILYIDGQGRPIKLEDTRTEPVVTFSSYDNERLAPGQDARRSVAAFWSRLRHAARKQSHGSGATVSY